MDHEIERKSKTKFGKNQRKETFWITVNYNNHYQHKVYALSINTFGNDDFYLFTEDEFEKVELFFGTDLVDFMPKVIAMGVIIAIVIKKRQSPASTYGR